MISDDIRRLAKALGVANSQEKSVLELIRSIQYLEGQMPCFSETWSAPCRIESCPFSDACHSYLQYRGVMH